MAFRAVWHLAPYGTSRLMAPRAVRHLAQYGTSRLMALRALWHLAPSSSCSDGPARACCAPSPRWSRLGRSHL